MATRSPSPQLLSDDPMASSKAPASRWMSVDTVYAMRRRQDVNQAVNRPQTRRDWTAGTARDGSVRGPATRRGARGAVSGSDERGRVLRCGCLGNRGPGASFHGGEFLGACREGPSCRGLARSAPICHGPTRESDDNCRTTLLSSGQRERGDWNGTTALPPIPP